VSKFSITLGEYEDEIVTEYMISHKTKKTTATYMLIQKGLNIYEGGNSNEEKIRLAIREQVVFTIKPITESLATLSSKVAHLSGRSVYLLLELMISGLGHTREEREKIKEIKIESENLSKVNMKNK